MSTSKIILFSGSGLSAESGIPTFRSSNGIWDNVDMDQICNFKTWQENYDQVHRFYDSMRTQLPQFYPNDAHRIIAEIQRKYTKERVILITQNVDDLLERSGCEDVIHVHGEITKMRCLECQHVWEIGYTHYDQSGCPKCQSQLVKPDVIFFYEHAPLYAKLIELIYGLSYDDTLIVIGTSGSVVPIDYLLNHTKAALILNNLEPSDTIDEAKFSTVLFEQASTALPKIESILSRKYPLENKVS